MAQSKLKARQRRHERVRKRVTAQRKAAVERVQEPEPYLRSAHRRYQRQDHYCSILDGEDVHAGLKHCGNVAAAKKVGASIAERALGKNIKVVVFDRGGYQYHGCVKALADAAREKGLSF